MHHATAPQRAPRLTIAALLVLLTAALVGCSSDGSDGATSTTRPKADATRNAAATTAPPPTVAAGYGFTCGRTTTGAAACWGAGNRGQLGDGANAASRTPTTVKGLGSGVAGVTAGTTHACAVTEAGTVSCWGANASGQLGDGTTTASGVPVPVTGLTDAARASASADHTCALTTAGAVTCWGAGGSGQLGNGAEASSSKPVEVDTLSSGAVSVAAGRNHTCAATEAGEAWCWGANVYGQLGTGDTQATSTPAKVAGVADVIDLAAGSNFTCALTSAGAVSCWGGNTAGQLGTAATRTARPVAMAGLDADIVAISAGNDLACARTADGAALCWGSNAAGQLGTGTTIASKEPITVTGLDKGVTSLSAGAATGDHVCAVIDDGTARCWGGNAGGQLGNDASTTITAPAAVTGPGAEATDVQAGGTSTCGRTPEGAAVCWGDNAAGQLGTMTRGSSAIARAVTGLDTGVTAVAAGAPTSTQSCAVVDGGVRCWGTSTGGLGDGTGRSSATPVAVSGLSDAAEVSAGGAHACARTEAGAIVCWGRNLSGEVGDGTTTARPAPVPVSGIASGATSVHAGRTFTCATIEGGTVRCWGDNSSGQLGIGSTTSSSTPVAVTGLPADVTAIATGRSTACAVTGTGEVWCWGDDVAGQVGDGGRAPVTTPVRVPGLSGATAVAVGTLHACAIVEGGEARCWGQGIAGQLGNGATKLSSTPVAVQGLTGATAITAGNDHTCALTAEGPSCWGSDAQGQVGVAPPTWVPSKVSGGLTFS